MEVNCLKALDLERNLPKKFFLLPKTKYNASQRIINQALIEDEDVISGGSGDRRIWSGAWGLSLATNREGKRWLLKAAIFCFFFKNKCLELSFFVGPLIPLFWTSGDICPGFQDQGGFPHLHASSPANNGFCRFTSGVTPGTFLVGSMALSHFDPHTCV